MSSTPNTAALLAVIGAIERELLPDFPHHAALAATLAAQVDRDLDGSVDHYCSGNWWGGSGSVFDVGTSDPERNRRLWSLLRDLVREFESFGVTCSAASARARVIEGWLSLN